MNLAQLLNSKVDNLLYAGLNEHSALANAKILDSLPLHQTMILADQDEKQEKKSSSGPITSLEMTSSSLILHFTTAKDPTFQYFCRLLEQFEEEEQASSLGSGVIVNSDGLIVTNQHVVEAADEIEVSLNDGRTTKAELVGTDPETDLAVLRIKLDNLPSLKFAAEETVKVGDVVLAMGNPFGVGQTVTMGIVSALGRNKVGINTFENFIQTDAAINPGNSGGALVDTAGNLLGINTAIYSRSGGSLGIGFAIPAKTVQGVLNQIVRTGTVTRGYIGVEQQNITEELATAFNLPQKDGVIIAGIVKDGPADKAGLKVGDILLKLDGQKISDTTQMLNLIAAYAPGEKKSVELLRDGKNETLNIEIGVRPKPGDFIKR